MTDAAIELLAAHHLRIDPPFLPDASGLEAQVDALARCIGAQLLLAWGSCGRRTEDVVLSSTVLSGAISGDTAVANSLLDGIEAIVGCRPVGILHSYMCTGWGYAIRFFGQHVRVSHLTVVVVDVDVHDFNFRRAHAPIGWFGFGVTTAVLRLPGEGDAALMCGGPYQGSAFNELIRAMKMLYAQGRPPLSFVPYLRDDMIRIVRRVLGEDGLAPNRYEDFGHCFGSDTWIGVIDELLQRPPAQAYEVAMGAIAFNGYFCVCRLQVGPATAVSFQCTAGDALPLDPQAAAMQAAPEAETHDA